MSNVKTGNVPVGGLGGVTLASGGISITITEAGQAAVEGQNTANDPGAIGVRGNAPDGSGTYGNTVSGTGVYGNATSGVGVRGVSQTGDAVVGLSHSTQHAGVSATNDKGGPALWASGTLAGEFLGDVHVTGTLTVDVDIVLTNAADFAEEFDVTCDADSEPGTVMVLSDNGGVQPGSIAYDRKVAGIVSGAGDYRPGIVLDRRTSDHPRRPLALVGKVYCQVDASYAPIAIGDLLTTSPTLGHAMKATDPTKSFGAVIGKALRPVEAGRALIPVLVALQ